MKCLPNNCYYKIEIHITERDLLIILILSYELIVFCENFQVIKKFLNFKRFIHLCPQKKSFWTQEPSGRNVNIGQYVFNSNLKCWILQNVMLYFVCLNVKARLLYYKANLILSLSTCQRTRQNVFEYLLSNNLKIRKESPNSSLEEKPRMLPQPPPPSEREKGKKRKKKTQQKRILPSTPVDRHPQSYLKYQ